MPEQSNLLPPNSTALERRLASGLRVDTLSVHAIPSLYNARTTQPAQLPWLAWAVNTLAWPRNADETAKRNLIDTSWRLHRIQGTLAGYQQIAALYGATVIKALTPPNKVFASPALSVAERNAFISRYPQLRIYRRRTAGLRYGLHLGDTLGQRPPLLSDAAQRMRPRAYLFQNGAEAELHIEEASAVTQVTLAGIAAHQGFVGTHRRYPGTSDAAQRLYRLALGAAYQPDTATQRRGTATPGMATLGIEPDNISEVGYAPGIYAGQFVANHLRSSEAATRIYQRFYLYNPATSLQRRSATVHLNAGRLGMPAHHAQLDLRITGSAHPRAAGRYCTGHLITASQLPLHECLDAMRGIARASDRIAINTQINRPATAGESTHAGAQLAGSWVTL